MMYCEHNIYIFLSCLSTDCPCYIRFAQLVLLTSSLVILLIYLKFKYFKRNSTESTYIKLAGPVLKNMNCIHILKSVRPEWTMKFQAAPIAVKDILLLLYFKFKSFKRNSTTVGQGRCHSPPLRLDSVVISFEGINHSITCSIPIYEQHYFVFICSRMTMTTGNDFYSGLKNRIIISGIITYYWSLISIFWYFAYDCQYAVQYDFWDYVYILYCYKWKSVRLVLNGNQHW